MPPIISVQPQKPNLGSTPWIEIRESECFLIVRYIPKSKFGSLPSRLQVRFRKYGEVWEYSPFPEHIWESFIWADSKGRFYNYNIKGRYPSKYIGHIF